MNFTLSVIVVLAGALGVGYVAAGKTISWKRQAPILVAIAATLIRVWLLYDRRLIVEGHAGHDAYLFVWQAAHIIEGLWLGEYNYLTLTKSPFLSIWMALMFWLGIPYLLSQHLLYVACSALMIQALRPAIKSAWAAAGLYLLLLFNPATYTLQVADIVSRMGIYNALVLGVAACSIGLFLRFDRPLANRVLWAGGLGVLLGCFLITREAGIWVYPMLVVLCGGYLWKSGVAQSAGWFTKSIPLMFAAALAVSAVQGVAYLNWKHYGQWNVTEYGHPSFAAAYGALSRIVPDESIPYVPVTRASRLKAYAVSPAFSDLERHLEGDVGLGWAQPGMELVGLPPERREIAGGWFVHALREAAMWQEYHVWPSRAMEYYQRVADEINAACETSQLECYRHRTTFAPVWRPEWKFELPHTFGASLAYLAGFEAYASVGSPSDGQDWVVEMFSEVTRARVVPRAGDQEVYSSVEELLQFKRRHLDKIAKKYQALGPFLAALSIVVLIAAFVLRRGIDRDALITISLPIVALLASVGTYSMLLSLIEISSFSTFRPYLLPGNALLITIIYLSMCLAREVFRGGGSARELEF